MSSKKRTAQGGPSASDAGAVKKPVPAHPDFSYLKSTSEKEDILFVVHGKDDDDVAFPVHLVKLSSLEEGNVLRVLSDTSDRSSEGIYRVELPHVVTASGFHAVLRCLYGENVEITEENMQCVLATAHYCMINALERKVIDFVEGHPDAVIALKGLVFSRGSGKYGKQFAETCRRIDPVLLRQILRRSSLFVHNESSVSKAAQKWAEHRLSSVNKDVTPKNLRAELGDALFLIRYGEMTMEEFAGGPHKSPILTESEKLAVWGSFFDKPQSWPFGRGSRKYGRTVGEKNCKRCGLECDCGEYVECHDNTYLHVGKTAWDVSFCGMCEAVAYRCRCGVMNYEKQYVLCRYKEDWCCPDKARPCLVGGDECDCGHCGCGDCDSDRSSNSDEDDDEEHESGSGDDAE